MLKLLHRNILFVLYSKMPYLLLRPVRCEVFLSPNNMDKALCTDFEGFLRRKAS